MVIGCNPMWNTNGMINIAKNTLRPYTKLALSLLMLKCFSTLIARRVKAARTSLYRAHVRGAPTQGIKREWQLLAFSLPVARNNAALVWPIRWPRQAAATSPMKACGYTFHTEARLSGEFHHVLLGIWCSALKKSQRIAASLAAPV